MEYIVWVVAVALGFVFLAKRDDLEKATGFITGLTFATVIGMFLGGTNIATQIGWIAVCQFSWTLLQSVQVGFKRFRNTLVVGTSIVVIVFAAFLLRVSSPPGFLTVAALILIIRWFASGREAKPQSKEEQDERHRRNQNRLHNLIIELDRMVERSSRWASHDLWPWFCRRNNRRIFISLFLISLLLTSWNGTNGIKVVPDGHIALVRDSTGQFESRELEPGLRVVLPYLEQMVLIPLEPRTIGSNEGSLRFSGTTADGFKVSVDFAATIRLDPERNKLIAFYQGEFRGNALLGIREALEVSFAEYLAEASVQNFLPIVGSNRQLEAALLPRAKLRLAQIHSPIKLETLIVKRIWNEPILQVPIDALRTSRDGLNNLNQSIQRSACFNNPTCK